MNATLQGKAPGRRWSRIVAGLLWGLGVKLAIGAVFYLAVADHEAAAPAPTHEQTRSH